MALPARTPEQRIADLAKGAEVRAKRADVKRLLKQGTLTIPDVLLGADDDEALAKMKVTALVQAMPGVGTIRARQIMDRLGIAENRRVRGLGPNQREALAEEFAA